jgi:tetratricopeptide (TPR) repeat protein
MYSRLNDFIALLDDPEKLRALVENHRGEDCSDVAVQGFLAFYDSMDGDCEKIKHQILVNQNVILRPLTKETKRFSPMKVLRYAAVIAVLIGSGVFYNWNSNSSPKVLKNTYKDPGLPNFMGTTTKHSLAEIMFYYRKKEYKKAGQLADVCLSENQENDTLIYYSGLLDTWNGKEDLALQKMQRLIEKQSIYSIPACYAKGLIFVQDQNYPKALMTFEKVAKTNLEPFSSYAIEHVEELRKIIDKTNLQAK